MRKLEQEMLSYFTSRAREFGADDVRRVGWNSWESQRARFEALLALGDFESASVLDVGSGVGAFYQFLIAKGFKGAYTGFDLIPQNCLDAVQECGKAEFQARNVLTAPISERFDYVVASGIFFLPSEDWNEIVTVTLNKLFDLCSIGCAANFLSTMSPLKKTTCCYVHPCDIINRCSKMTPYFKLRHDYAIDDNDFTVYLYRHKQR